MSARLLHGSTVASKIHEELTPRVAAFSVAYGRPPGLGIVLVGDNPASEIYVRRKLRAAGDTGFRADLERLPAAAEVTDALAAVRRLNESAAHDGILVQAPLPRRLGDTSRDILDAIDPAKDVDGFHPLNVGRLVQNREALAPCTPLGVIELLDHSGIRIGGSTAVVLGRSDIVGKPMAILLLHRDATVVICHSRTRDLQAVSATADILVVAMGRPLFVTREFVKPGATVIDVGINRVTDPAILRAVITLDPTRQVELERRGSVLVGDVHPDVAEVAGALTPVPGGVGPLTVAMLLKNTLRAAEARMGGG